MSYSRWSDSYWYSYMNPDKQLVIEFIGTYSYSDVKNKKFEIIDELKTKLMKIPDRQVKESDFYELEEIMDCYCSDYEREFL